MNKPMTERVELTPEQEAIGLAKKITATSVSMRSALDYVTPGECFYLAPSELASVIQKALEAAAMKPPVSPSCALREALETKNQAMELMRRVLEFYKEMKELHDMGDDLDCLGDRFNDTIHQFEVDMAALAQAPVEPNTKDPLVDDNQSLSARTGVGGN
jgi:hypothetical protein